MHSPPKPVTPSKRLLQLDALRAVAAFLVLCMHTSEAFVRYPLAHGRSTALYTLSYLGDFGRAGVVLFFIISGYVVPGSLHTEGWPGTTAFLRGRIFRLYPAFLLSIVPGAWSAFWLWGREFSLRELLLNATMLPQTFGARPALWPYWTLRVEWIFYALCIALHTLGLLRSSALRRAMMSALGLLFIHGSFCEIAQQRWFLEGMLRPHMAGFISLFLFGAHVRAHGFAALSVRVYASVCVLLLPLLGRGLFLSSQPFDRVELLKVCAAYPAGLALFVVGMKFFSSRPSVASWLGARSYGVYLFHPVVLNVLLWRAEATDGNALREASLLAVVLLVGGLSTLLAHGVFQWVELPAVAFGKRLFSSNASFASRA